MNAEDRKIMGEHGQILARLDERSNNTWRTVEDIKKDQGKQNDAVAQNTQDIAVLKDRGPGMRTKIGGGIGALGIIAWNVIMWLRQQPPA